MVDKKMIEIPKQLRSIGFKFCLVEENGKKPIEKEWTTNKNYEYNNPILLEHIKNGGNYGVLGGCRGLVIIDFDTIEAVKKFYVELPQTFEIKTAGRGLPHCFFFIDGEPINIKFDGGDIRGKGGMVVAPNSSINGKKYEIIKDLPIANITNKSLIEIFNLGQGKDLDYKSTFQGNINEGNRNDSLFKAACSFKSKDIDKETCFNLILSTNEKFKKPLEKEEVITIVNSAFSYKNKAKLSFAIMSDRKAMAEAFHEKNPFFYDRGGNFWFWDNENKKYDMWDDIDIMNAIDDCFQMPTTRSQIKQEILESMKRVGRLHIPQESKISWVQTKSGVYDCETGELLESSPNYFLTNPINLEIGESEETPVIDRILEEWVGKEWKQTLYEILAYCMLPNYPIHRIFCFIGSGMNGKSKFLGLLRHFIGKDNISSTQLDLLTGTNKSRFETIKLYKKLVCEMGETNFKLLNETNVLKQITGQDLVSFEIKGKTPFSDYSYAKILIATNSLPPTTDKTTGFYRRWIIIDFPNTFSEKKDILSDVPIKEYNNLLKKCLRLLKDLIINGTFSNEGSIEDRKKRYEDKSDPLQNFIEEKCEKSFDEFIYKYDFKDEFFIWAKVQGHRQWNDKEIGNRMKDMGFEDGQRGENQYRAWLGLKWKMLLFDKTQETHDTRVFPTHPTIHESELILGVYPVGAVSEQIKHILMDRKNKQIPTIDLINLGFSEEDIEKEKQCGNIYENPHGIVKLI